MSVAAGPYLAAAGALPLIVPADLPFRRAVILAPHPDDESLGCGALLAALADLGGTVRVVFVTDGAASHPGSRAWPRERLAALRRDEALAALAELGHGPKTAEFLDLPDAASPGRGSIDFGVAAAVVNGLVHAIAAEAVVTTWCRDPHHDHRVASDLAREAADAALVFEYPVWGWNLPPDAPVAEDLPRGFRLDPGSHLAAKRRAIARHASQLGQVIDDDPGGFVLDPATLARFERPEIFLEEA